MRADEWGRDVQRPVQEGQDHQQVAPLPELSAPLIKVWLRAPSGVETHLQAIPGPNPMLRHPVTLTSCPNGINERWENPLQEAGTRGPAGS